MPVADPVTTAPFPSSCLIRSTPSARPLLTKLITLVIHLANDTSCQEVLHVGIPCEQAKLLRRSMRRQVSSQRNASLAVSWAARMRNIVTSISSMSAAAFRSRLLTSPGSIGRSGQTAPAPHRDPVSSLRSCLACCDTLGRIGGCGTAADKPVTASPRISVRVDASNQPARPTGGPES